MFSTPPDFVPKLPRRQFVIESVANLPIRYRTLVVFDDSERQPQPEAAR
jgi:hypothetical protein